MFISFKECRVEIDRACILFCASSTMNCEDVEALMM